MNKFDRCRLWFSWSIQETWKGGKISLNTLCKVNKFRKSEITRPTLWKWVHESKSDSERKNSKSSQHSFILVLILWASISCVFCMLLKVVVITIWVFCPCQWWVSKRSFDRGIKWAGGVSSIHFFLTFFFNFVEPLHNYLLYCSESVKKMHRGLSNGGNLHDVATQLEFTVVHHPFIHMSQVTC